MCVIFAGAMTDIQFREGVATRLTVETDTGPRRIPPTDKIAVVEITRSIRVSPNPALSIHHWIASIPRRSMMMFVATLSLTVIISVARSLQVG